MHSICNTFATHPTTTTIPHRLSHSALCFASKFQLRGSRHCTHQCRNCDLQFHGSPASHVQLCLHRRVQRKRTPQSTTWRCINHSNWTSQTCEFAHLTFGCSKPICVAHGCAGTGQSHILCLVKHKSEQWTVQYHCNCGSVCLSDIWLPVAPLQHNSGL